MVINLIDYSLRQMHMCCSNQTDNMDNLIFLILLISHNSPTPPIFINVADEFIYSINNFLLNMFCCVYLVQVYNHILFIILVFEN